VAPAVSPDVAREALRVVRRWVFRPPVLNGREVSVLATFMVDFHKNRSSDQPPPKEVRDERKLDGAGPKFVQHVIAGYTPNAMRQHISGSVTLEAEVLLSGHVGSVRVIESLDTRYGLDELATRAMEQCIFTPARLNGRDVVSYVTVIFGFVLK